MSEEKSLVNKLAKIMNEMGAVPKTGWNNFNKYNYTTEADIQAITSKRMAKENIIMTPYEIEHSTREVTTRKGNAEYVYQGTWDFEISDGDSGEKLTIRVSGEGQDSGDKGPFKALTGAHKYALMKLFQISTGDDPERDVGEPNQQPEKQDMQQQYNHQELPQQNHDNQTTQQVEPNINDAILTYVKQLKELGVNVQQLYVEIAQKEGVNDIKEVDRARTLGHIKAYLMNVKNQQQPQQTQQQSEPQQQSELQQNYEQGSVLQGRTTQPTNWGNK